jgi:hypothetical protein
MESLFLEEFGVLRRDDSLDEQQNLLFALTFLGSQSICHIPPEQALQSCSGVL